MPEACTHLYVHFVWGTWDRLPLLSPDTEARVHACIVEECRELKCQVLAVNGTEDHVHLLARLHAAVSAAQLAKQVKGSSSHLVTHVLDPDQGFKWQGSYGAFSVSESDVPRVRRYIETQKAHHASGTTVPEWERCSEA